MGEDSLFELEKNYTQREKKLLSNIEV